MPGKRAEAGRSGKYGRDSGCSMRDADLIGNEGVADQRSANTHGPVGRLAEKLARTPDIDFETDEIRAVIGKNGDPQDPRCGIDSVIGSRSGFPLTPEFLAGMKQHWF